MWKFKFSTEGILYTFALVIILLSMPVIWVSRSHMEANAYNRVTGENVSTWDAMWIELRVIGNSNDTKGLDE